VALLLGRCPILLIDEPELGLHPPQAYAIGRFIGKFGESKHHGIFVATHSSHVLRGVIEVAPQAQILRLSRWATHFVARFVDQDTVKSCLDAPTARAETVLDGLFSDGVVVVESEGDRVVYQAAWDGIAPKFRRAVHFVPVGGTGGIAQAVRLYRALKIPTAVIADLDLLLDSKRLKETLSALLDEKAATQIRERCRIAAEGVCRIPPAISEQEVKTRLTELISMALDWQENHDDVLSQSLRGVSNDLDRMRRLKKGGVGSYAGHPEIAQQLQSIIDESAKAGLFLVPVGELEHWGSKLMSGGPRRIKKAEWASEAARRIRRSPEGAADIIGFVRRVGEFELTEAERLAMS
jgi:predicted ATP-dependent endonuclease of OLD family